MTKQVFYDPQRKRWKRLRRILDVLALLGTVVFVIFIFGLLRVKPMKELLLPATPHNYRALTNRPAPPPRPYQKLRHSPHRKTDIKPSDVPLNAGEGLRAAYYVEWDPASYASLKQHIHQIDLLFPEWLHVVDADGGLTAYTIDNRPFDVVDQDGVHNVDRENKVARAIADAHEDTEIFPLVNNYDPTKGAYVSSVGDFLQSP
ncbi:MAG TPA: polysaccharide deacetylase, partial [Granulicella sp.]|nr:polysaccharide deacetylase [Granulicella sp.]